MWEINTIPGFREALESERIERAAAFIGIPEEIYGIKVQCLTPFLIEKLSFDCSPFMLGEDGDEEDVRDFLWLLQPEQSDREAFDSSLSDVNYEALQLGIENYLNRAFLDAPSGKFSRPYYSITADLITAMAMEPFRWPMDKTLHTDIRILYQLIKCSIRSKGGTVINRKSDAVSARWMREDTQVLTAPTKQKLHALVLELQADWQPASEMSPNMRVSKNEEGIATVSAHEASSWSVTVMKRRKAVSDGAR